jgi:deoxyribonuclease V
MKWPVNINEARELQCALRKKIKINPLGKQPEYIAGVDAAFSGGQVIGTACLYRYPELILLEETYATACLAFPYVPGYLSFREGPAVIKALKTLKTGPDLILFDGQGIAHPAGMGIATHIGMLLRTPAIGCAKSRLVGNYKEPGITKGSFSYLRIRDRIIGAVVRTRENVKPVFVSPGHMIDLKDSIDIVLHCTGRYRIPEPLREADRLSKTLRTKGC